MDGAHLVLYLAAAFLAVRTLVSLMQTHKQQTFDDLLAQEARERKAARRREAQRNRHAA